MKAIYKRELGAYFKSLTGPVFIALFLAATGVYTAYLNLVNRIPSFELSLYNMSIVFLIAIPLLTMRSFAQERRQNTAKKPTDRRDASAGSSKQFELPIYFRI